MFAGLERISNFTYISEDLAIGGQPPEPHFAVLQKAGFGLIVHIQIKGMDTLIRGEEMVVVRAGMLYENITIDFNAPSRDAFLQLAHILGNNAGIKIFVHCTAGFCSSALLLPYLIQHYHWSLKEASEKVVDWILPAQWENAIKEILAEPSA